MRVIFNKIHAIVKRTLQSSGKKYRLDVFVLLLLHFTDNAVIIMTSIIIYHIDIYEIREYSHICHKTFIWGFCMLVFMLFLIYLFVCFFPHIFNKSIHMPISHIITTTCPLLSRSLSCTDLSHHSGTQNLWGCPSGVIGSHLSPLGLWGRGIRTSGLFFHIPWILDWIGILGVWRPGQSLGLILKPFQGSFCSVDGHIVLFVGGGGGLLAGRSGICLVCS